MWQLTTYALRGDRKDKKVLINWAMHSNIFSIDFHDNTGISHGQQSGQVPLDRLMQSAKAEDRADLHALKICYRAIIKSKGLLLFSASTVLGGTMVSCQLPVLAHHDEATRNDEIQSGLTSKYSARR
jgi:hypothetical protein